MRNEVELRVGEIPSTNQDDVGRGIVRIPARIMRFLNIGPGDAVEIEGQRITAAVAEIAYPMDANQPIIRMDGLTRKNARVGVGELVRVRKAIFEEAKELVIAPIGDKSIIGAGIEEILPIILNGRVFVEGDYFMLRPLPKSIREDKSDDIELLFPFFDPRLRFIVVSTNPAGIVRVTKRTRIVFGKPEEKFRKNVVTYEDIGGLDKEIQLIREIVELPLKHPELFKKLGIEPPKGVLLYGPPGTGKTLLAKAVANESQAYFIYVSGPEIISKYLGEAEQKLRKIFAEAQKRAPSIIFIDEIDAIASRREESAWESKVVAQLLTLMDGLKSRGQVIVIAATNRPEVIDPALRRPGRFDREIEIGVPDRRGRLEILRIHTRGMPLAKDVNLEKLAELTPGFTGADLAGLVREAAMKAIRRILPKIDLNRPIPPKLLASLKVEMRDFMEALKEIEPSAMRELIIDIPNVSWQDVGGLEEVKRELREAVELPIKKPEVFREMGINPPKGVLLYGPPGTGKTLLAKAVANSANANFIAIKGPEIMSKWVGESERMIREIFRKARQLAPSIIFFDEIDAIAQARGTSLSEVSDRVVNQLLTELDGIEKLENVFVIAATNRPDLIDLALLRPGRIDRHIYVPPPDEKTRVEIFKVHTRNMPLAEDVDLEELARLTNFFTGADIEAVCREAGLRAIRENRKEVRMQDFLEAIEKVGPSLNEKIIEYYESFRKRFRSRVNNLGYSYHR